MPSLQFGVCQFLIGGMPRTRAFPGLSSRPILWSSAKRRHPAPFPAISRIVFARDLLDTLRCRELESVRSKLSSETGLPHQPSLEGEHVSGVYRRRVALASGRFAMIDNGLGFQLVPWRPALEQHLGRHVSGVVTPGGGMDWSFGRKRGLGL